MDRVDSTSRITGLWCWACRIGDNRKESCRGLSNAAASDTKGPSRGGKNWRHSPPRSTVQYFAFYSLCQVFFAFNSPFAHPREPPSLPGTLSLRPDCLPPLQRLSCLFGRIGVPLSPQARLLLGAPAVLCLALTYPSPAQQPQAQQQPSAQQPTPQQAVLPPPSKAAPPSK